MQIKTLLSALFFVIFLSIAGLSHGAISAISQPEDNAPETIELPFKDEPFAVFIRGKTLWLVANDTLSLENLSKGNSHFITNINKLPATKATVLLFSLSDPLTATIEKSSDVGVRVILQRTADKLPQLLPLSVHTNEATQYVLNIAAKSARNVISVVEPATGNELKIIPLTEAGSGFYPSSSFPQFNILQTAQGIVVQKTDDTVAVSANKGVIEISALKGLKVSPAIAEQMGALTESTNTVVINSPTLFPYASWKLSDDKNYVPTEIKLFHEISYGTAESANKARLRLLQIYLSEGLFAEALGMSNDILRNSYKFYHANKIAAMRGVAYLFMQHLEDAKQDFSSPDLANDKEALMWLGLCKEMLNEENGAFNFVENYDLYISKYPPVFIQKLALIAADSNINLKSYDAATDIFSILTKANLDEPVGKYIDYMRAKIFSETKSEEEATKIWEKQAGLVDDPLIRASAKFSLINMLLRQDRIATEKAIKDLEKLLIVWRGDSLELSILTLLGNLYIEEKQYGKALRTLKEVVLYYPQSPQTLTTTVKMEEIFTSLFNKGGADTLPPLEALSVFYEFRDLVPSGRDGDMMIRNLADRLAGIDLLDRAAELLNHQVQKRLQGSERSRVGARLAAVYLQNHQPREALDTLKTTGYGELSADLQLTRLRLTAQALAEQGHSAKAIEVLNNDNSAEGTLLRLAIYWANKDWPNVTLTAEEILSNRTDPTAALNIEESGVLLKLATGYVYEHDNGQIQYLRDYFTPLLKDNPDKNSFLFITSESGTVDYETLANLDHDIDTVKSFVESARSQAKEMK